MARSLCFRALASHDAHGLHRGRARRSPRPESLWFLAPASCARLGFRTWNVGCTTPGMLCQEIMHRRVCSARDSDDLALVARTMRDEDIGFMPVLDSDDVVVGVVTDRDIVVRACVGAGDPRRVLVGSIMSGNVASCRPTDPVETAEHKMRERRVSRLVIIDSDGALAGVISLSDIAQYDAPGRVGRTLQAIAERKYAF